MKDDLKLHGIEEEEYKMKEKKYCHECDQETDCFWKRNYENLLEKINEVAWKEEREEQRQNEV